MGHCSSGSGGGHLSAARSPTDTQLGPHHRKGMRHRGNRHHDRPLQGPQHRHHGSHRCRQDHDHRADPVLHRYHLQIGEVHEGAATMDWMEQEQERGIIDPRRPPRPARGKTTRSTSSTPPDTSTSPSRSSARCGFSTAPLRYSTASPVSNPSRRRSAAGGQVPRAAHVLRQQARPHRC